MMQFTLVITGMVFFVYTILIAYFLIGLLATPRKKTSGKNSAKFISVVIAVRNERSNIPRLIARLKSQTYPKTRFEVLICDDHSDDGSQEMAEHLSSGTNIRLLLPSAGSDKGKKAAITRGISNSRGEIIVTTDADCLFDKQWLQCIAETWEDYDPAMVIGPVSIFHEGKGTTAKMEALEFLSIMGVTAGSALQGNPIMCNGANLAFRIDLWKASQEFVAGKSISSGDDMFLLHAFKKLYPGRIIFQSNPDGFVSTMPAGSLMKYKDQRTRWASKFNAYNDSFTILTGLTVAATNIVHALFPLFMLISNPLLMFFGILWFIRLAIDFTLLFTTARMLGQQKLLWYYPLVAIIYPYYVTAILAMSFFTKTKWKGRVIKTTTTDV